jgi:hypothetical protein
MKKIIAIHVLGLSLLSSALAGEKVMRPPYSLKDVQGAWWSDCGAAAVEFFIEQDTYSGDFLGSHKLTVSGDVLVFNDGLLMGHGVDVSGRPLALRILRVSESELVLRAMDRLDALDWHLYSCRAVPSNSSFNRTPDGAGYVKR